MFKRLRNDEKGFTLMEIVIVIVILGILALLAIPRLLGFTEQAELATDKEYAAVVARAGELYWASHNKALPNVSGGAIATVDDDVETLIDAQLIDSPVGTLQYNDGVFTNVAINIVDGVATVNIVYVTGGDEIEYSTSGGYSKLP